MPAVAPLVGAWIEIATPLHFFLTLLVAPLVGAWIEIETYSDDDALVKSLLL